jgi:hypothetical protein
MLGKALTFENSINMSKKALMCQKKGLKGLKGLKALKALKALKLIDMLRKELLC